jgi:peptide/nickel transport system permease protein
MLTQESVRIAAPVQRVKASRKVLGFLRDAPLLPFIIIMAVVLAAIFADVLALHDPEVSVKDAVGRPVKSYLPPFWMKGGSFLTPLGTDFHSRDILSRLLYGARVSLLVGVIGTLVAGALGTTLGIVAGYLGGWYDQVIMRITDAWMALPSLIFAIFLASVLKPSLWNIIVILALVFWSQYARIIRAQVLSLRERQFVQLAEVSGASTLRVVRRHILPNVLNTVMVLFSLTVGVAIIIESSLSFLWVGVPPPKPAWGLMMSEGRGPLIAGKWWLSVFPGLCIMLLVLATNLLGDWLRVRLDPQLRHQ